MSISSINQRTEFLSQDQQQWENSAMMLATSEQPKREGQDQNTQEERQALKEREGRKEGKKGNIQTRKEEEKRDTRWRTLEERSLEDKVNFTKFTT
jgi:hypothetical protein